MDLSSENFIISPSDSERITKEFNEGLDKLTFNCRNTIHGLTKYASTRTNLAPVIANLLEIRVYKSAPAAKLPYLYLLDSIVKNIGKPYIQLFSAKLKPLFLDNFVTLQDDKSRSSFLKVLQTWRFIFDRSLIHAIESEIFGSEVPENYSSISSKSLAIMQQMIGHKAAEQRPQPNQSAITPEALEHSAALLASLQALKIPIVSKIPPPKEQSVSVPATNRRSTHKGSVAGTHTKPINRPTPPSHPPQSDTRRPSTAAAHRSLQQPLSNSAYSMRPESNYAAIPSRLSLTTEFINRKYKDAHYTLYNMLKLSCNNCGLRFESSVQGKEKLAIHLDWHFKRNRRQKERLKRPVSRDWFPNEKEWIASTEMMEESSSAREKQVFAFPGSDSLHLKDPSTGTASLNTENGSLSGEVENAAEAKLHTVPTRLAYDMKECIVCGDKFKLAWNEDADEWVYENAVLDEESELICHFTCSQLQDESGSFAKRFRQ